MKAEINNENKAKFFVQYWGQKVLIDIDNNNLYPINNSRNWSHDSHKLQLKPLSSISDEDAIEVGRITSCWNLREIEECGDEIKDSLKDFGILFCGGVEKEWGLGLTSPFAGTLQDIIDAIDYLRSKGYALPWMGLSVFEMVKAGWIKLIEG